jgi:cardiolipin synthase
MDPNGKSAPLYTVPGPLWYHRELPDRLQAPFAAKRDILRLLSHYPNVRALIINKPGRRFSIPIAGRSHIKTAIIDNYVFIGGCNLDSPQYIDLMLGWDDAATADALHALMSTVAETGNARQALGGKDQTIVVDDTSRLLIDAGVRGQSRIFDEALKLIDSAREWLTITCQFFPNSITARHLLQARQRGVKLDIIYSHPNHHGLIGGSGQKVSIAREKSRLPADMFKHMLGPDLPMIHAKVIACDQGLLIGSHNYVRAGVRLGTAEIALQSTSTPLAHHATTRLQSILDQTSI